MLYMRFQPIDPKRWAALSNSIQVAEVTLNQDGLCAVTPNRSLCREELASVLDFVADREAKAGRI
jgi:hypothetical protein